MYCHHLALLTRTLTVTLGGLNITATTYLSCHSNVLQKFAVGGSVAL